MSKILKDLRELLQAKIITEDEANRIQRYYETGRPSSSGNRLLLVFGILGSLLIGLGIVLIVAHNWDTLPKSVRLFIGLFPMIVGQSIAGYIVIKTPDRKALREGTATFLCLSVALSISIVAQVYNRHGSLGDFLLIWMVLTLPIIYVLRSSMTSLLFIIGITWYASEVGYFGNLFAAREHSIMGWPYWPLLLCVLPYYYFAFIRPQHKSNFYYFHSWLIALSLTICLGLLAKGGNEQLLIIAYMNLFSIFVMLGGLEMLRTSRVLSNGYLVVGSLGVLTILFMLSFDWYWGELKDAHFVPGGFMLLTTIITSLMAAGLLWLVLQKPNPQRLNAKIYAFLVLIVLYVIGVAMPSLAQIATNLAILVFAVYTIRDGARRDHLGILNYGLIIIATLIISRFFDTQISFVVRGVLFIVVGAGFFVSNAFMIRRRKLKS